MMRNRIKTAAATIAAAAMLLAGTPTANASAAWSSPFGDVTPDTAHATDINWVGNWGIAQG